MVKDRKIHYEKAWEKTRINQFFIIIFIKFATQKSEKFPGFSLSLTHPILISSASFPYPFQCFTMSNLYKNYTVFFVFSCPNLFLILYKLCLKNQNKQSANSESGKEYSDLKSALREIRKSIFYHVFLLVFSLVFRLVLNTDLCCKLVLLYNLFRVFIFFLKAVNLLKLLIILTGFYTYLGCEFFTFYG